MEITHKRSEVVLTLTRREADLIENIMSVISEITDHEVLTDEHQVLADDIFWQI